jgi:microcystin-dependent protein
MSDPYVGEIRMFGGNFAPAGWAFCDGQLLPIAENDQLFTLIGTTYGGDGENTFALPDLRGRIPLHFGTSTTGTTFTQGEAAGSESVTLTAQQIPLHAHPLLASGDAADQNSPANTVLARASANVYFPFAATAAMNGQSIAAAGGSQPHNNMMPFLCISFIISLFGFFPTQT